MGMHNIATPAGRIIKFAGGCARLCWSGTFGRNHSAMFSRKQKVVDSEVLRYCAPLIPFRTGALTRSGTNGTVIGSGTVRYSSPYARFQYYQTAQSRSYDPHRGSKWFERMKAAHKADILGAAKKG